MPNINLLPTLPVATSSTFVIASENGFAKRISFADLSSSVAGTVVGDNRTDQPLFTTSSVQFGSIVLSDNTPLPTSRTVHHGFSTFTKGSSGDNVKLSDSLGQLRFSGYDGVNSIDSTNFAPTFLLSSFALENFEGTPGKTINAGTGWRIAVQPTGTQLLAGSRQSMLVGSFRSGPSIGSSGTFVPPIASLTIGSGVDGNLPTLITSAGQPMQLGYGRTDVSFINSTISQLGVTISDPAPQNESLTGTNFISIHSSRYSGEHGYRASIKNNDNLGGIDFRATYSDETTSTVGNPNVLAAVITARALEDFSQTSHRSAVTIYTTNANSNANVARFEASDVINKYNSEKHVFYTGALTSTSTAVTIDSTTASVFNGSLEVTSSTVSVSNGQFVFHSTGTLVFPDATVQTTGYPGYTGTRAVAVPPTSTSYGLPGDIAYDSTHVYICVAANTWRRMNATTF